MTPYHMRRSAISTGRPGSLITKITWKAGNYPPCQAKTVRKIFDMYIAGKGYQKIKKQLEMDGDLTALGKKLWHFTTIGHVLQNRLYCGELEYRKEYVPDYLEQKRAKNHGEVERVIVQGRHEPIVSKEEFELV